MAENKNLCHYCRLRQATTRDHVVPKSRGGTGAKWNFVPSCFRCNQAKSNRLPTCACGACTRAVRKHWEHIMKAEPYKRWPMIRPVAALYFDKQPEVQRAWNDYVNPSTPIKRRGTEFRQYKARLRQPPPRWVRG